MAKSVFDTKNKINAEQLERINAGIGAFSNIVRPLSELLNRTGSHVTQFSDKLSEAAGAGARVTSTITSFGVKLGNLQGPISVVVGALTSYSSTVRETKQRISELARLTEESIQNTIDALIRMGAVSKQQQLDMAEIDLARAESEKKMLESRRKDIEQYIAEFKEKYPGLSGKIGQFVLSIFGEDYETLLAQNTAATEAANAKIAHSLFLVKTIQDQIVEGQKEQFDTLKKWNEANNRASNPRKLDTITPQSLVGGVELGKPKFSKVPTTPPEQAKKEAKETFIELTALSKAFEKSFLSGISSVQTSIGQGIGGVFQKMFGEANSFSFST